MKSREYYAGLQKAILAAPHVIQTDIAFDEISEEECYIRGVLTLSGGYELHILTICTLGGKSRQFQR